MVKNSGKSVTTTTNSFAYKQGKINVSTTARGTSSGIMSGGGQKSVTNRKNTNRLQVGAELGEF